MLASSASLQSAADMKSTAHWIIQHWLSLLFELAIQQQSILGGHAGEVPPASKQALPETKLPAAPLLPQPHLRAHKFLHNRVRSIRLLGLAWEQGGDRVIGPSLRGMGMFMLRFNQSARWVDC